MIETVIVLVVFAFGIVCGWMFRDLHAMDDWREGYESCQRDWRDYENARALGAQQSKLVGAAWR